jgi:hypothetical protein
MALYGAQQQQKVAGEKLTALRIVLTLSKSLLYNLHATILNLILI